jgi:small subunit ribosomal protein S8
MSVNDPLGDMLTRIRNALMRNRTTVTTPASKLRGRVLEVLLQEGFIRGYSESTDKAGFQAVRDRAEVL